MSKLELRDWDGAGFLDSDEARSAYLDEALRLSVDDPGLILVALGTIARSRGMTDIARETGLGRESLYKALSAEGNPSFVTVFKVARALGIGLSAYSLSESR